MTTETRLFTWPVATFTSEITLSTEVEDKAGSRGKNTKGKAERRLLVNLPQILLFRGSRESPLDPGVQGLSCAAVQPSSAAVSHSPHAPAPPPQPILPTVRKEKSKAQEVPTPTQFR